MKLYVNGCSYTANQEVPEEMRYPALVANALGAELIDNSWPGSSNARIIRTTIRDCIPLANSDVLALIQLTHLHRFECPSQGLWTTNNDRVVQHDTFVSIKLNQINLPNDIKQYAEWYWRINTDQSLAIQLLTQLIGLTAFFQTHNIKYRIYFGPKELEEIDNILYKTISQDKYVIDLVNFTMLETITGTNKHPTIEGNKMIADYFINLLCESV
jgi:hypothetical protein